MHLLGRVHHLEVGRKTAHELGRSSRVEMADQGPEVLTGLFVAFAAADRAQPRILDHVEQFLTVLLANQFADHRAERAHVVAQRLVLFLEGDVLPPKRFLCNGTHLQARVHPAGDRHQPQAANSGYFPHISGRTRCPPGTTIPACSSLWILTGRLRRNSRRSSGSTCGSCATSHRSGPCCPPSSRRRVRCCPTKRRMRPSSPR